MMTDVMTTFFETNYVSLAYDEYAQLVKATWKGAIFTEESLKAYKTGANWVKTHKVRAWLDDVSELDVLTEETFTYLEKIWFPQVQSVRLRRYAVALEENPMATVLFQDFVKKIEPQSKIVMNIFEAKKEALKWLMSND